MVFYKDILNIFSNRTITYDIFNDSGFNSDIKIGDICMQVHRC